MSAVLTGTNIAIDEDGYLLNAQEWTPAIAEKLAQQQTLILHDEHWQILYAIRNFYQQYQRSPTTRVLLKYLGQTLGSEKSSSIYVMALFGDGTPAKTIARLAGLPKPANCI